MTDTTPIYITEIYEEVQKMCESLNISKETTTKLQKGLSESLSHRWGGLSVYFLKDFAKREAARERNELIYTEYDGKNTRELAKKFGVTEAWVYSVCVNKYKDSCQSVFGEMTHETEDCRDFFPLD